MANDRFWNRIRKLYQEVQQKQKQPQAPAPVAQPPVPSQHVVPPAPTEQVEGPLDMGQRLAMINQAGDGNFLLEVLYNNVFRLVEPYSLRTTGAGNVNLMGHCLIHDHIHAFRIDKIQAMTISTSKFSPRWTVEVGTKQG